MCYIIKEATTEEEMESVYSLRYRVYVEEEGKFSAPDFPEKKIKDRFDCLEETRNILIFKKDIAVGTVRFSLDNPGHGVPAEELYDFSNERKNARGKISGVGMLAIEKEHRNLNVFFHIIKLVHEISVKYDIRWIFFPLNHEIEILLRRFGAEKIGEKKWIERIQNYIVPMKISVEKVAGKYEPLFKNYHNYKQFLNSFYKKIYRKGEVIIEKGCKGNEVYFLANGSVRVIDSEFAETENTSGGNIIPAGECFGEVGLSFNRPRSATVLAEDREVELYIIPGNEYLALLRKNSLFRDDIINIIKSRYSKALMLQEQMIV